MGFWVLRSVLGWSVLGWINWWLIKISETGTDGWTDTWKCRDAILELKYVEIFKCVELAKTPKIPTRSGKYCKRKYCIAYFQLYHTVSKFSSLWILYMLWLNMNYKNVAQKTLFSMSQWVTNVQNADIAVLL